MLVHRTAGRAEVRRSTSGEAVRSSMRPHTANSTTAATSRTITAGLVQPQSLPLEIASSRQTSAADRPIAPGTSKRPPDRDGDSATTRPTSRSSSAPRTAAPTKSQRQLVCCATSPVIGSPTAPPIPSDELISAIPLPTRSGGRTSRMMLIPSGTTPSDAPCSTRATSSISTPGESAPAPSRPSPVRARRAASGVCRTCRRGDRAPARTPHPRRGWP